MRSATVSLLLLLATTIVGAAPDDPARAAYADGDISGGVARYRALLTERPDDPGSETWSMMLIRGLSLLEDHAAVVSTGLAFQDRYPSSRYREKVAFLTAKSLLATGNGEAASALMAESVERLRTTARAGLVARLVAEAERARAGRPATGPFGKGIDPDPQRAYLLLSTAAHLGFAADRRDALRLTLAEVALEAKDADAAFDVVEERTDPAGLLLRARALVALNRVDEARETVERILATAPDADQVPDALLLLGDVEHLARFLRDFPEDARAPAAALRRARAYARNRETERAVAAFDALRREWPDAPRAEAAAFEAADALRRARQLLPAKARYEAILRDFPASARRAEARGLIIATWLDHATALLDANRIDEGASALARLRDAYPLCEQAPASLLREALRRKPDRALALLAELLARYPGSEEAPEGMLRVAELLALEPGRHDESVAMLRRLAKEYPNSVEAETASERLEEMQQEWLEVHLPAPRTTDEPRTLLVRTRNLERLTGRVYRFDAEAYFRVYGRFDHVDSVMVDVIEPDARFTHAVADYAPHRLIEGAVTIPGDGPGAWIVVLEGETLRATGLLLVSDLTVITKATPTRTLAFVQDARTGEPRPGVRVIARGIHVPDGDGVTGEDGTTVVPLARRSASTVLAVHEGSVALAGADWDGWSTGVSTAVHLATDRTVYRPGDRVRFRAIVRKGVGEMHVTPTGEPIRFTVTDRSGYLLLDATETLTEYGTAAGEFVLPADARPGDYEIVTRYRDQTWETGFPVEAYRKPALFLDARPERSDHVRGDTVTLLVSASHAAVAPAADHAVRVRVSTLRRGKPQKTLIDRTLRTDGQGRAKLMLPTRPGPDLSIRVRLDAIDAVGRPCRTLTTLTLPRTSYRATLSTARPRCFLGDEIRVNLLALDVLGDPAPAAGAIEVSHRDVVVATLPVVNHRDGRASIVYRPEAAGPHRFRFRGRDRADRAVTAVCSVDVRVPEEERLVVLADSPRYVVGDTARIEVSSPRAGLYALLSYEGEELYGHRVVRLDASRSRLDVPVAPIFAPDVRVRVALAYDGRLHTGEDRIRVRPRVKLTVEPERGSFDPGGNCRIRIRTTDVHGRPAPAEIGIAVVDEAIFRLHPDETPTLEETFRLEERDDLVATGSSLDFSHSGEGDEIGEDLLAERARRAKGKTGTGVLLEEKSLDEKIGVRRDRRPTASGGHGGAYRGPSGSVPANMRKPWDGAPPGVIPVPGVRRAFEDTALFLAHVVTDAKGEAVVTFRLPDDLTTWRITARAVTRTNAFDETRAHFTTSKPVSVRLGLPRFLREGDRVVASAAARNDTDEPVRIAVDVGPEAGRLGHDLVPPGRAARFDWPLAAGEVGTRKLHASSMSDGAPPDRVARSLSTLPRGVPFRTGFAGSAPGAGDHVVTLPADRIPETLKLTLRIDPSRYRTALDGLTALSRYPHGCTEQTANRILPALALRGTGPSLDLLEARDAVHPAVIRLGNLRNGDGLWGWWEKDRSDPEMTAYALLALAAARDAGHPVPKTMFFRASKALRKLQTATTDPDRRAFLLLAMTRAFGPGIPGLAAAFGDRARLSPRGLAFLALAHEALPKRGPARILREDLAERITSDLDTETLGWALAALAGSDAPSSPVVEETARLLVSRRDGAGFGTTRATGAAVLGLARMVGSRRGASGSAPVRVTINGATVLETRVSLDPEHAGTVAGPTLDVPTASLREGTNAIRVEIGATVTYTVTATGLARTAPRDAEGLALSRTHALLPLPGDAPGGENLVREDASAREPVLETLRVGEGVRVTLRLENRVGARFLAVEEPLPAGFEPVLDRTTGPVAATERFEDRVVFFLTEPGKATVITYVLRSELPGTVHVPPAMAYAMYRPRLAAWSKERILEVVARNAPLDRDPTHGLDAAGLWWRAWRTVADDPRAAAAHLRAMLERYDLRASARREAQLLLARAHESLGEFAEAARCFDRLLAESVDQRLRLPDQLRRARVYRATGRHAEAVTALEIAGRDVGDDDHGLADEMGGAAEDIELSLLERHPFSPLGEEIWRARAMRHARRFERALRDVGEADPANLVALREFQARYPRSPSAPDIAFRLTRALLRAGRWAEVEHEARRLAERTRDGVLADDADWFEAFALFAQGKIEAAATAAEASLKRVYRHPDGRTGPSGYRRNLVHLLAQVAHVEGRLADAVRLYEEVKDYTSDAREAYGELTERRLAMAEVARFRSGDTPSISLVAKNLTEIDVTVHAIDILIYFTVEKEVDAVGHTNLDGLAPIAKHTLRLPEARDHRRHRTSVPLPDLGPGVYLVVAGSGSDIEERCVLIVSDLEARIIDHDRGVRVLVTDSATGRPAAGAFVKVAADGELIGEGFTDPRGVFEVKGRHGGKLSAVARKGKQAALASE